MKKLYTAFSAGLLLAGLAQAAVYDIGTDSTVTYDSSLDTLTNTGPITDGDWTDSTLKINDGSNLSNTDFTALGITSWATGKFSTNGGTAVTNFNGANLSGLGLTFSGNNFGYNDTFVGADFSNSTISNASGNNQFFLFSDLSYANFSGATININGNLNTFRDATLTGADFSNITWGVASSVGFSTFFSGGAGSTSVADKNLAANFSGADLSNLTGTAATELIANLGKFDGGTAIGAFYDDALIANSGGAFTKTALDAAGWQSIPEPSSYALLAGLLGMSCVMARRRRA
ncbi:MULTISPECIES: PEP-CTERM sorting domain-containing protein [unclassified Lentimonas]|uniref:PEP-CTERM sorting domain-containing protein n=1 Tax=unclassified Lentimonas TaxID=2630993 RepID=UPI001328936B|nr:MULTISPECIES: PEP-CTERM sorting domain-containing protein [unclassified Lentimonas]CAA6679924.1 Unannotated [Lentimonas sp. CC4]CAA6683440.1 Unannotated [Lentimonas sp. CC6]CAA7078085.1 Unannotated [Lentimonas sp. CC4]CAA7171620.1 Unannotated [Lentimonas sp. CC21]CAA7181406.1 Unannotated [Lentimonas sp. CC8]